MDVSHKRLSWSNNIQHIRRINFGNQEQDENLEPATFPAKIFGIGTKIGIS